MTNTKYEELQFLTKDYGEKTWEFLQDVKASGRKIVEAYAVYLGGPKAAVNAVPPRGEFKPGELYRDAAFDCFRREVTYLEPISMGVCTNIRNQSDEGTVFVRTIIQFQPSDPGLRISVGNQSKQFHSGNDLEAVLQNICEAIFDDVHKAFSLELDQAKGRSAIGFFRNTS